MGCPEDGFFLRLLLCVPITFSRPSKMSPTFARTFLGTGVQLPSAGEGECQKRDESSGGEVPAFRLVANDPDSSDGCGAAARLPQPSSPAG